MGGLPTDSCLVPEEVVVATRTQLLRAGAVTDGYAGIEPIPDSDTMLLALRWRRDPNMYAIEIEYPNGPEPDDR